MVFFPLAALAAAGYAVHGIQEPLMIKILPTGTTFSVLTGRKPVHKHSVNGRLGEGAGTCVFSTSELEFTGNWGSAVLDGVLRAVSDVYVSRLSLSFQYRSPRPVRETALWAEASPLLPGQPAGRRMPGTLTLKVSREGDGFLWLSEAENSEGMCFFQSPPVAYPVHFSCCPRAGVLKMEWALERTVKAGEEVRLTAVSIGRGFCSESVERWRREWRSFSGRTPSADRRIAWWDSGEAFNSKELREILVSLRGAKIPVEWFALSPRYAAEAGDWLTPGEPFRDRMGNATRAISDHHMVPGLRFAPFLVSRRSVLASEHRDWLLTSPGGTPVTVPAYEGSRDGMWVLDITRSDVRSHILNTLSVMRNQWGFRAFLMERVGDAALPGLRNNETLGPGKLCDMAAELLREGVGNRVFLAESGIPAQVSAGFWDARFISPVKPAFVRNPREAVERFLHQASWEGGSWINVSGPLPLSLFGAGASPAMESLLAGAAMSSGAVFFTGTPETLDETGSARLQDFLKLFAKCRGNTVRSLEKDRGRTVASLVIHCRSGHLGLFNFSSRKQNIVLGKDSLKGHLEFDGKIAAGDNTVFNSQEIHVVLPPGGHRIFQG